MYIYICIYIYLYIYIYIYIYFVIVIVIVNKKCVMYSINFYMLPLGKITNVLKKMGNSNDKQ